MDLKLQGKHAIVTGSSKGIGRAIAAQLAEEGARVVVCGRTRDNVEQACARIRARVPGALLDVFVGDLATAAGAQALVAQVPDTDILVNNVGIYERKPFEHIPDDDWQRFFDVNVMSGVRLSRHYLVGMKTRNWGRIVFISSESGLHIPGDMVHYGFSKTAQLSISRGIAETCAGTQVTCNAVLPGPTRSDGVMASWAKRGGGRPQEELEREFFRTARPSSLLQRLAEPEEVATMVAYVCSPLASATNGAALRVEGGIVRACN